MARNRNQLPPQRALVAAARKVALGDKRAALDLGRRQEWQSDAWAMWRAVPEVKQAMLFLGNAMAKLRLLGATWPAGDPDGDPVPITDEASGIDAELAAAVQEELAVLHSEVGGQPELLRKLNLMLEVPGEGFLVGFAARMVGDPDPRPGARLGQLLTEDLPESWDIKSTSEVTYRDGGTYVRQGPNDTVGRRLDPDAGDDVVRIYQADPEWSDQADSPMQGVLFECRLLQALSHQQLAVANSQMHSGVFTLPNELSFGPAVVTEGEDGDEASDGDPFTEEFDRSFAEPIEMPDALGTVRPMLLRGPAQYLTPEYVRHIALGRAVDATLDTRIELRVTRIARGINLPVEVVQGHMATTFANAEQIDQDLFDDHLEPRCRLIVDALTIGYLRPRLTDPRRALAGLRVFTADDVADVFVWYDPSALVRQPDIEANADAAHEKNTISDRAYRAAKGYSEDDAPDALELVIRNGMKRGILTAELTGYLLQALADEAGIAWPDPAALAPGAGAPPPGAAAARDPEAEVLLHALWLREQQQRAARGEGGGAAPLALPAAAGPPPTSARPTPGSSNAGARLVAIDRELRAQLLVAANDAMERALEKAGARLRSRQPNAARAGLADVPLREMAGHLGRQALTAAGTTADELFADAWQQLEGQFMEWGAAAQQAATDVVYQVVGGFTAAERASLGLRQADDLAGAWGWMREALQSLASGRLFDPTPAAPALGEFDPTLSVPTGLVRQAIARAGGAAGLTAGDKGGAWVTLADGGTRPAGGIATGETLRGVLRDGGAGVEAYVWVYGPARRMRPFEPHVSLDGVTFRNFDDAVLANTSGWPDLAFYLPGDHAGCNCDIEPIIIPADAPAAQGDTSAGPDTPGA